MFIKVKNNVGLWVNTENIEVIYVRDKITYVVFELYGKKVTHEVEETREEIIQISKTKYGKL